MIQMKANSIFAIFLLISIPALAVSAITILNYTIHAPLQELYYSIPTGITALIFIIITLAPFVMYAYGWKIKLAKVTEERKNKAFFILLCTQIVLLIILFPMLFFIS